MHVVGLGGIGSALFLPLIKLGVPELVIWDDDVVEPHNIPAQLIYRMSDVGLRKTDAAFDFANRQEATCKITAFDRRINPRDSARLDGIVICGVDSMASRKDIWECLKYNPEVALLIDARMGGEQIELYCCRPCDPDDIESYEDSLADDDEIEPLPCAERTVIHPPVVVAGMAIAQLTRFVRELPLEDFLSWHLRTMDHL